jgi:putative membrane protein
MRGGIKTLERKDPYYKLIVALSIIIPVAVAALFGIPKIEGYNTKFLPPIYATINGLTAVLLVISVQAIRRGKRSLHELLMKLCIGLSALFLVMYIAYHITNEPTSYGGEGVLRYVYFFILISHILLSICVIPFVLFTFARALTGKFQRHKELAKYTYPLWLYVAVTGVIVYFMISPYYAN